MKKLATNFTSLVLVLFLFNSASAAHFSSSPQCKLSELIPLEKYLGKSDVKFRKYFPYVHEGNSAGESTWSVEPKDFHEFQISRDVLGVYIASYKSIIYNIIIAMPEGREIKSLIQECGEPSGYECVKNNKAVEVAVASAQLNTITVELPKVRNKMKHIKDRMAPCDFYQEPPPPDN